MPAVGVASGGCAVSVEAMPDDCRFHRRLLVGLVGQVQEHDRPPGMPELLAKAKANPGKLNWASPGAGTTPYLAGELLQLRTGTKMVHIPFAGAGPATQAAVAGQVDMVG